MSYNLKRWGDGRSDNVELLDAVRDIASKHDIICFQELFGDSVKSLKQGTFGTEFSVVSIEVDNLGEKLAVFYRADRFKPLVQFDADGFTTVLTSKSEPTRQKKTKRRSLHVFFEDLASNEQFLVSTAHVTPDAKEETIKELNYLEGLFSGAMKVWGFNMDNHGVPIKEQGKSKVFLFDMMMGISRLFSGSQKKNIALPNRNWKILEPFTVKKLAFALIAGDLNMDTPYVNADRRNLNFYKTVGDVPVYVKWFDKMKTNTGTEPKSYSNMISRADGSLFDCRVDDSVPDKVLREISDHYPIYCVVHSPGQDTQLLLTAMAKLFTTPITQSKTRDEEEEGRKGEVLSEKRHKKVIAASNRGSSAFGVVSKSFASDSTYSRIKHGLTETAESSVRRVKDVASGAIVPYISREPYFLQ
jgi:endonuclease/exonuclease/phosphatase family metal-dependent hydrolase